MNYLIDSIISSNNTNSLDRNKITDVGAKAIAESLIGNKNLKNLL